MVDIRQTIIRDIVLHDVFAIPSTRSAVIVRALFSVASITAGLMIGTVVWRAGHPALAAVAVAFGIERPITWALFSGTRR
jgi:hypothetical protein